MDVNGEAKSVAWSCQNFDLSEPTKRPPCRTRQPKPTPRMALYGAIDAYHHSSIYEEVMPTLNKTKLPWLQWSLQEFDCGSEM